MAVHLQTHQQPPAVEGMVLLDLHLLQKHQPLELQHSALVQAEQ